MADFLIPDDFVTRNDMKPEELVSYRIPLTHFRVHDAQASILPAAATADDLGLINGTFGTTASSLQTSDAKATTVTQYGRVQVVLPAEYDNGQSVTLAIAADMETTVSDGTATIDVECYKNGAGSDICATAAQSCNALTSSTLSYVITPTGLVTGDLLDIRITAAITDSATGTAVVAQITSVILKLDVRG
jgi:hypothetical protein